MTPLPPLAPSARPRHRFVPAQTADRRLTPQSNFTGGGFSGAGNFEALKRAGWKGWFFFPSLQPMRRMTPLVREQINRAAQWLYDNTGFGGAIVDRLAIYEAGAGMWPKAATSNPAFNTANTDLFHQSVRDARFFDLAKADTFYSAQVNIRRHIRLYGDHFGQLVRGTMPQMRFLAGYCIGNGNDPTARAQGWSDGVLPDAFGAPLFYRVVTTEDGSQWQDVPADDMLHFHDHFLAGQTRGLSIFARCAEKMFTIDDIIRAEANGMLARARMGYALTVPNDNGIGPELQVPGAEDAETVTEENGKTFKIQRIRFPGGDEMDIPELPPGYGINTVESNRPGPNQIAFMGELKRDISLATGYIPEFIDFIADSGGAVTRFVLEDTQGTIDDKQQNQLDPQFAHRFYVFSTWQRILAGQFDKIDGGLPADWWRYRMIYPKQKTVDKGREGKLDDARLDTGKISPEMYSGPDGDDAEEVEDQVLAARERRETKLVKLNEARAKLVPPLPPLVYEDIWPKPVGTTVQGIPAADDPPPDDLPITKKPPAPDDQPGPPKKK